MSTNTIPSERKSLRREHNVVSQEEWIAARKELLKKEKIHPTARPVERRTAQIALGQDREELRFDAPGGKVTLADLFAGRSQSVIYLS